MGGKEGLAIWGFCGGCWSYTHHCGCTTKSFCARQGVNRFCLEYFCIFSAPLFSARHCLGSLKSLLLPLWVCLGFWVSFFGGLVLFFFKLPGCLTFCEHQPFQLISVLQGIPSICLVHHTAVINAHVLLFP